MRSNTTSILSLSLGMLVIVASTGGVFFPSVYAAEKMNWQVQCTGQDFINLFLLVPSLFISARPARKNNQVATTIWGGCVLYLAYTFSIYCFDIHFNRLFIVYCMCLGLSVYSFIYFMVNMLLPGFNVQSKKNTSSIYISVYFIIIAILFYVIWLSEIIPANLQNITPANLKESGLVTNGVQVLDLAIMLPAIIITAIFLMKRRRIGFILTPVLLVFFILIDLTIGFLQVFLKIKGLVDDLGVTYIMLSLALISGGLLQLFYNDNKSMSI